MCREAISARMDNEDMPAEEALTNSHLLSCANCRAWERATTHQMRTLRIREVVATPDLTQHILRAAKQDLAPATAVGGERWRWLLGVVALAQLTLGLGQLLGVSTHGHT